MLKAGTKLTPELIAKIHRIGLESVAIECVGRETADRPAQSLLMPDEVERLDDIVNGRGSQTELRQIIYDVVRRLDRLKTIPEFRIFGPYERTHAINVFTLSLVVGHALEYGPAQLVSLGTGALLHDMGKLVLPEGLVAKPSELDDRERELMRQHTVLGVALLARSRRFTRWLLSREALEVVRYHHERLDGSGYPAGLSGAQIPRMAMIVAVADMYDAMVSERPHARRKAPGLALQTLRALAGRQLDPAVVSAFVSKVLPYPAGSEVVLSDRRRARVLRAAPSSALRPLISIDGEEIDLAENRQLGIAGLCLPRRFERAEVLIPVRIRQVGGLPLWGRCLDVSSGGACLEVVGPVGEAGDLEIQFCAAGSPTEAVRARICWKQAIGDGTWKVGVQVEDESLLSAFSSGARAV